MDNAKRDNNYPNVLASSKKQKILAPTSTIANGFIRFPLFALNNNMLQIGSHNTHMTNEPSFNLKSYVQEIYSKHNSTKNGCCDEDIESITSMTEEFIAEACKKRKKFASGGLEAMKKPNWNAKRKYNGRITWLLKAMKLLFLHENVDELVAYLVIHLKLITNISRIICGAHRNDLEVISLNENQALNLHFSIGSSYALLDRVSRGIKECTNGLVKLPSKNVICKFKNSLSLPSVNFFNKPLVVNLGGIVALEIFCRQISRIRR